MTKNAGESPQKGGAQTEVWGYADVAKEIDVQTSTVRYYWSKKRHLLPDPDVILGGKPGWFPATVREWKKNRPGQGFRTDLTDREA